MPLTFAAPALQGLLAGGRPSGCSRLNASEPAVEFAVSAPIAFCGSLLPERKPITAANASTTAATAGVSGFPELTTEPTASATGLPVCGLATEVTEATRSGRTEAT